MRVLFLRVELGKGLLAAIGHEHRIVAETQRAARRPGQRAIDAAFVDGVLAIGPCERQHAGEPAVARSSPGPCCLQHSFDLAHRHVPVAARLAFEPLPFGPVGGVDAGPTIERSDRQAAIVGEGGEARSLRRGARLDQRVLDEGLAGFRRLGQAERAGRDAVEPIGLEQRGDFLQLARIMRGDDQLAGAEACGSLRHRLRPAP